MTHVDAPVVPGAHIPGEPDRLGVVHVLIDVVALGGYTIHEEEVDIVAPEEIPARLRYILLRIRRVDDRDVVALD